MGIRPPASRIDEKRSDQQTCRTGRSDRAALNVMAIKDRSKIEIEFPQEVCAPRTSGKEKLRIGESLRRKIWVKNSQQLAVRDLCVVMLFRPVHHSSMEESLAVADAGSGGYREWLILGLAVLFLRQHEAPSPRSFAPPLSISQRTREPHHHHHQPSSTQKLLKHPHLHRTPCPTTTTHHRTRNQKPHREKPRHSFENTEEARNLQSTNTTNRHPPTQPHTRRRPSSGTSSTYPSPPPRICAHLLPTPATSASF